MMWTWTCPCGESSTDYDPDRARETGREHYFEHVLWVVDAAEKTQSARTLGPTETLAVRKPSRTMAALDHFAPYAPFAAVVISCAAICVSVLRSAAG